MRYVTIQVMEVIDGKLQPINHELNKDEREVAVVSNIPNDKLAKVKYSVGMTVNIGNYQSAKVDVGVELPTDVAKVDETYEQAVDFCNEKLVEEVSNLSKLKKSDK